MGRRREGGGRRVTTLGPKGLTAPRGSVWLFWWKLGVRLRFLVCLDREGGLCGVVGGLRQGSGRRRRGARRTWGKGKKLLRTLGFVDSTLLPPSLPYSVMGKACSRSEELN